jgi:hypothetical protein
MNSEEELFAALEKELSTRIASSPHSPVTVAYTPRRIVIGILLILLGLIGLITSVVLSTIVGGVAAFTVMFAGGYVLSTAVSLTRL